MLNTYNPPTQPRAARCFELGRRIAEAVASFEDDQRIGILASGGLTHFVIDEEFAAGACEGFRFHLIDYVPGYRTRARTGTALGFATWS